VGIVGPSGPPSEPDEEKEPDDPVIDEVGRLVPPFPQEYLQFDPELE